ncbi:ROK family protein [Cellulomonas pakistanensis]|uniref:Transcriptional regulator n=1 Tax=Cellulomonas pakistanensis TaxID=992287 RepID=A0A919PA03_9CELL|nr:ROK family protein [Cellulomonas pakistanensis]GIG34822.1 transcriptional regulator [Cellulomonas pakistanensis]
MTTQHHRAAPRPASLDAVLSCAWEAAELTASDVIAATGLTRSTAIDALDALTATGLLRELPNAREAGAYRKGRPARRFELRADAAVLVGVDSGQVHVTATVTDLRCAPLGTARAVLDVSHDDPARRRAAVLAVVDEALAEADRSRADVLALCVGVPAPVNTHGASPPHPDGFWDRMNPGFQEALADQAPVVLVENDASLAAVAEGARGAAVGCRNYVALLAGERLGAGVVVDGRVLHGTHGGVGEMVAFDLVEGVGAAYGLGARAAGWAADAVARGEVAPGGPLTTVAVEEIDGRLVLELAAAGDTDALRVVERVGAVLARVVSVLASMFDPERIVVSGAVAAGVDQVVEAARAALPPGLHLPAPDLVVSPLGADVVVTGAIAQAHAAARRRVLDVWAAREG